MTNREARAGDSAAILIDADNLSPAAVDQAFMHMAHQGWRVTLRRAYGGHEKLAGMKDCLLRHGVRSLVNNGKGTTDALLVVDAMDLLHEARRPRAQALPPPRPRPRSAGRSSGPARCRRTCRSARSR